MRGGRGDRGGGREGGKREGDFCGLQRLGLCDFEVQYES